jgi:hypothetical protein
MEDVMSTIHTLADGFHFRRLVRRLGRAALTATVIGFATVTAATAQQSFKTPQEAVETFVAAVRAGDRKAINAVLGPGAEQIISSGDAVQDENIRKLFLAAYDLTHSIQTDGDKPATLLIGRDEYPFAIPIAKKGDSWMFDTAAGREEVLARRIGRNELAAIQVCLAYYDAQYEYAETMPKVDDMAVYAQRVVSSPGKKDGLYWPSAEGQPQSPLGEAVAAASLRGYRVGSGEPFHGYYYKILTRQGSKAPGGAHDFIVDGKMIGGFALIAWPAEYGNSGITTFLISHDGAVYEKDLGKDTAKVAARTAAFNPDDTWKKVVIDTAEKK